MARENGRRGGSNVPRREQDSRDNRIEKLERENAKLIDDLARTGVHLPEEIPTASRLRSAAIPRWSSGRADL